MQNSILPVSLGGRYQTVSGLQVRIVSPSDSVALGPCAQLFFTAAGNVTVKNWDGTTTLIPAVAGMSLPLSPEFVMATGTNVAAGNIFALY